MLVGFSLLEYRGTELRQQLVYMVGTLTKEKEQIPTTCQIQIQNAIYFHQQIEEMIQAQKTQFKQKPALEDGSKELYACLEFLDMYKDLERYQNFLEDFLHIKNFPFESISPDMVINSMMIEDILTIKKESLTDRLTKIKKLEPEKGEQNE